LEGEWNKLTAHRTHISIIADILDTAREYTYEGKKGVMVTHIISRAHVPHARLSSIISELRASGLLYDLPDESKYCISEKGIEFLQNYRQFKDFAGGFGLSL
jgi:predicted transcriptional regulator